MKLPYRITSCLVVGTFVLTILAGLFVPAPQPAASPSVDGTVGWEPCSVWVQYGPMHAVVTLVCFGTLIIFTAQGLRNRSGPRWLAILGMLSLVLVIEETWWLAECYGLKTIPFSMYIGAVVLMFLHHAVQNDWEYRSPFAQSWSVARKAYEATLPLFIFTLVTWFLVAQVAILIGHYDHRLAETVISTVQHIIRWPAVAIFPFAVVVTLQRMVASERN